MTAETHDEETARMLAELEGEQTEREQLEARAAELGVKFRGNTGDDTLRERIEAAEAEIAKAETDDTCEPEPEAVEPETIVDELEPAPTPTSDELGVGSIITNPGRNVRRIGNLVIAPSGQKPLTERDVADERIMTKVKYMIKLGVLHRGAD